jgi:serine/threonine protein kinase
MDCPDNKKLVKVCRPLTYKKAAAPSFKESKTSESFSNDENLITEVQIKQKTNLDGGAHLRILKGKHEGHRDYIIKEMTLPQRNTNIVDNAFFNLLEHEINTCRFIEKQRTLVPDNKILLSGIIHTYFDKGKTYFDDKSDLRKSRIQQEFGGEFTMRDYLKFLADVKVPNRMRTYVIQFLLFQCLCSVKSLHMIGIVHNDLHLGNILIFIRQAIPIAQAVKNLRNLSKLISAVKHDHLSVMKYLYKYSPFVIHIFDFDRAANMNPQLNKNLARNLRAINDTARLLSTEMPLPQNDVVTLTSMFNRYIPNTPPINYLIYKFNKEFPDSFETWGGNIRTICKPFAGMDQITIDAALDDMAKVL